MTALTFATCALSAVAAAPNMQPGMWEISMKSEMPSMPDMPAMPATTVRQCIRPTDVQNGSHTVPKNDSQCEIKDYKMQGNTATWRMECKGPNAMNGSGSMTYGGTSYSGTTKMTMKEGGHTMDMVQTFNGKRTGDCK